MKSRSLWEGPAARFNLAVIIALAMSCLLCSSQAIAETKGPARTSEACPRPPEGSAIEQPAERSSQNGRLAVALTIRNSPDANGNMRFCYVDEFGHQAPTLRVRPGDILSITLKNELNLPDSAAPSQHGGHKAGATSGQRSVHDPCAGGAMTAASANLHFHGLAIPPVCHQDETLKTVIEPGDLPFEYRVQIPKTQPPGLYWYHPHVHGFAEEQILGGASGAIIVEGLESAVPRVVGLQEKVLIIRDENMPAPSAAEKPDPMRPTKQLTVNYVPVPYPKYPPASLKMKPGERQLWRVLNASADTYLNLSVVCGGKRQALGLVSLDGVPLHFGEPGSSTYAPQTSSIFLPPATRAEFIVTGPAEGMEARLVTGYVYRGASDDDKPVGRRSGDPAALRAGQDDVDAARPLAAIITDSVSAPPSSVGNATETAQVQPPVTPLSAVRPANKRKLYFSERLVNPNDPKSATQFFITLDGHEPVLFDPNNPEPTIAVHQGDVEDWTIENRSRESHAFHVHQLHFIVIRSQGLRWEEPTLRDTIDLPAWDGLRSYPSVTVRMDFRDPNIVGTFPFHCHILQHLDGGMMGTVRVEPVRQDGGPR